MMAATLSTAMLLVASLNSKLPSSGSCFADNFFGTYNDAGSQLSILTVPDANCLQLWNNQLDFAHYAQAPEASRQLVWLEQIPFDEKLQAGLLQSQTILDDFWLALQTVDMEFKTPQQEVVFDDRKIANQYDIHYRTETAALVSLSANQARTIDTLLPPFWKSTLLPTAPVQHVAVSPDASDVVKKILQDLKFDPVVSSIVSNISIPQLKNDIRFLTGEDGTSGIVSRHSFSEGALVAAHWLKERVEATGAKCRLMPFLQGFAPNVICRYDAISESNSTVIVAAHYDSRGSFGSTRAPGGDDDGSGTTGVLSIARTIARKGVKFYSNVELAFFAGEEQGLIGSRAYAKELREAGANVTLMLQADMTAYRAPGEPLQIALPTRIGNLDVIQLVGNISGIYSPELTIGLTAVCCSDHQSFHEQGFPAAQLFERAGPIADPMYHNSGDLSDREGYDFEQLYAIAKVQFATILHAAGFEL